MKTNMQLRCVKPVKLCFAVTMLTFAGQVAEAQAPQPGPTAFTGVWRYADDPQEGTLRRQAIEAATKDMSLFIRGRARDGLNERTTPPREVELKVDRGRLELSRDGALVSLSLDAKPVAFEKDGRRGTLSAKVDGAQITVSSEGDRGKRVTTYALSPDRQRLTVSVRMTTERLSVPLVYKSTYLRK